MELLIANLTYVAYRLFVSGVIVRACLRVMPYWAAVLVMSQASFFYDNFVFGWYFSAREIPPLLDLLKSDLLYTARVGAAWAFIYFFWSRVKINYWLSIFIVAQATFFMDLFIFHDLYK